jgi:hypothetical protein
MLLRTPHIRHAWIAALLVRLTTPAEFQIAVGIEQRVNFVELEIG